MDCIYCHKSFSNKNNLLRHQTTAKYCLKIQGRSNDTFKCKFCNKIYSQKLDLERHMIRCVEKKIDDALIEKEHENALLMERLVAQNSRINELQKYIEKFLAGTVPNPLLYKETEKTSGEIQYQKENISKKINDSHLSQLYVRTGYHIEYRDEDGYIDITNLCRASDIEFENWNSLEKTRKFLNELSEAIGIPTVSLIQYRGRSGSTQGTWVHPQVAIHIAHWISPEFGVKVSTWVYEIMVSEKIDVTVTKSYQQLCQENEANKTYIKYLTQKYVKKQTRANYKEQNVLYILTTELLEKERRYILGKAANLTNRLSTYNKTDEHIVIYYQECGSISLMDIVEANVFHRLRNYREQANRERFILPVEMDTSLFINAVKECIDFAQSEPV